MSIVLAALEAGPAAQSVLDAALRFGEMTHCDVEAVHIPTSQIQSPRLHADLAQVPLHLLTEVQRIGVNNHYD